MTIGLSAATAVGSDRWGRLLPRRQLGRTGKQVTMLGLGGFHVGWTSERDAQEVIETAMEGGVRFFDTAESYSQGGSEDRYGRYLVPQYREEIFLMTKSTATTGADAKKHLDDSLRRMRCDYVDLWQVHAISTPADVDNRVTNGILDAFEEAKATGKARHIGFTGHASQKAHQRMLERTANHDIFETVQMPINVLDPSFDSFLEGVLPTALKRNMGILAMKTLADGRFFASKNQAGALAWETDDPLVPNHISVREALEFVWSLPVSVLITGAENRDFLLEKIELARSFTNSTEMQRAALIEKVAAKAGAQIEYYKSARNG